MQQSLLVPHCSSVCIFLRVKSPLFLPWHQPLLPHVPSVFSLPVRLQQSKSTVFQPPLAFLAPWCPLVQKFSNNPPQPTMGTSRFQWVILMIALSSAYVPP